MSSGPVTMQRLNSPSCDFHVDLVPFRKQIDAFCKLLVEWAPGVVRAVALFTYVCARIAKQLIWWLHFLVLDRSFDQRHGLDTEHAPAPKSGPWDAGPYVPTPSWAFRRILTLVDHDLRDLAFVDL